MHGKAAGTKTAQEGWAGTAQQEGQERGGLKDDRGRACKPADMEGSTPNSGTSLACIWPTAATDSARPALRPAVLGKQALENCAAARTSAAFGPDISRCGHQR